MILASFLEFILGNTFPFVVSEPSVLSGSPSRPPLHRTLTRQSPTTPHTLPRRPATLSSLPVLPISRSTWALCASSSSSALSGPTSSSSRSSCCSYPPLPPSRLPSGRLPREHQVLCRRLLKLSTQRVGCSSPSLYWDGIFSWSNCWPALTSH